MRKRGIAAALVLLLLLALACPSVAGPRQRNGKEVLGGERVLEVGMTLVPGAEAKGAVCLDGSPPAYHLHRGFGTGARNWLLQFEGGGWCNDMASCFLRSTTGHGSSRLMKKVEYFSGILSNDPSRNPDFYNWNRVKLRYCDGASFGGDSSYINGTTLLHFRGQRIWEAIIHDLLPKGLAIAQKALLSGCSAGGLATFLHCDGFRRLLPESATVKCLSDAGFFLDVADIAGNYTMRSFFDSVVALQGAQRNLHANCTSSRRNPKQCFFPQYVLPYIRTPYFILNAAYDVYQPNCLEPELLSGWLNTSWKCQLTRGHFSLLQVTEIRCLWHSGHLETWEEDCISILVLLIVKASFKTLGLHLIPQGYTIRQLPRPLVIGTSREEMLQKLTVSTLAILLATTPYLRNLCDAPLKDRHRVFFAILQTRPNGFF